MDMTQLLASLPGLGVGGLIALYLIRTTIPAMVDAFRAEMRDERASCDRRWEQLTARVDANRDHTDRQHAEVMRALQPAGTQPRQIEVKAGDTVPGILRASLPADKAPEHE